MINDNRRPKIKQRIRVSVELGKEGFPPFTGQYWARVYILNYNQADTSWSGGIVLTFCRLLELFGDWLERQIRRDLGTDNRNAEIYLGNFEAYGFSDDEAKCLGLRILEVLAAVPEEFSGEGEIIPFPGPRFGL